MSDLFLLHLGHHFVLSQVFFEQGKDLWDIFGLHLSEVISFIQWDLAILLDLVTLHVARHCLPRVQSAEASLDEFFRVDSTMIVGGSGDGSGHHNTSCVNCWINSLKIDSTGQFFDKQRWQTLRSQLLLDAEIIYLSHFNCLSIDNYLWWSSWNKS